MHLHFAWKGHAQNDEYCVGWDVKPYSLTHLVVVYQFGHMSFPVVIAVTGVRILETILFQHYEIDDCLEDNREDYQNCHFRYIVHNYNWLFLQFWVSFFCVLCFIKVKLSVKVKLFVPLLCVCAILPAKAVPEMTYTVLGGTLNPTHSLTLELCEICIVVI